MAEILINDFYGILIGIRRNYLPCLTTTLCKNVCDSLLIRSELTSMALKDLQFCFCLVNENANLWFLLLFFKGLIVNLNKNLHIDLNSFFVFEANIVIKFEKLYGSSVQYFKCVLNRMTCCCRL